MTSLAYVLGDYPAVCLLTLSSPPPPVPDESDENECLTLASVLQSREDLSVLATTAVTAGLDDVLNDPSQKVTLFAPIDSAFQEMVRLLGTSSLNISSNPTYLSAVLAYHAADGAFEISDLEDGQILTTFVQDRRGQPLTLEVVRNRRQIKILGAGSNATIVESNLLACDSVVHIVDTVLLPVPGTDDQLNK
eukprot:TRINITY_DN62042_c0_g1_i1.p2 TRINITY_DN62042_c0_g1~~TRINITY_DN62042_c0_g1_i1.p2  ORF type:complete len:192 (+),score=32.64 TRINITY_DN62042_c0_g1_i1:2-577(+)